MTTSTIEAVIAGSKPFALALLAPVTERVGTRPRIATDTAQAIALCPAGGLLVVEFQGEGSLRAIQDLVLEGTDLKVIAAVPEAHAAAEGSLRALGIDLARWDGKPDGVLAAIARRMAAAGASPRPAVPPPPLPRAAAPAPAPERAPDFAEPATPQAYAEVAMPPAPEPQPGGGLFDDLAPAEDDFQVDVSDEPLFAPAFGAGGPWPANVPGAAEAADALGRGLAGIFDPPGTRYAGVAEVVGSLSELERAVFAGAPQPIDTEAVRRAAVMRVRVAAALATAPAPGSAIDGAAVSALLAEIDALLSDVNTLAQGAPPELQPGLEQVRNALVKEAIDFSEAAHRVAPSEPIPAAAPVAPQGKAAQTRIVAMASKAEQELELAQTKRHNRLFVVLGIASVAAASFHGYRHFAASSQVYERARRSSAPSDSLALQSPAESGPIVVKAAGGKAFTADELKRLVSDEELKGNTVRQMGPNVVMIFPPGSTPPLESSAGPQER